MPTEYTTRILPVDRRRSLDLREIWRFRELLWFLALRDIKIRYKQTELGALWAILQPLLFMAVFSVFFGRLAGLEKNVDIPYPAFVLAGLLPWQMFAMSLTAAGNSLYANQVLVTKIYCPRLVIPMAAVAPALLDFAISMVLLLAMLVFYGLWPTLSIAAIPLLAVLTLLTALSVGLWLAILSVEYRDARHTIQFLTQVWLLATPVAYPSTIVPETWRAVYGLNPMVGVVEGFRWAVLGTPAPSIEIIAISSTAVLILLASGLEYFRRTEAAMADVI